MNEEKPILFPRYIGKPLWRTLAYYDAGEQSIVDEDNNRHSVENIEQIISVVFENNLLTFISSLSLLSEYIPELLEMGSKIYCNKEGKPISIKIIASQVGEDGKKHKSTRWIISSSAWGYVRPNARMLEEMRDVFSHARVGTVPTPGSLGLTIMRKSWGSQYGEAWKQHRHQRPGEGVCCWMKETGTGARSDIIEDYQGKDFSELIELDQKNGYGAAFCEVPTGTPVRFLYGDVEGLACYYAHCSVIISTLLSYGLFPFKEGKETIYPTLPGTYACCLWSSTIDFCREQGLTVNVGKGTGWAQMSRDTSAFVSLMEHLRDSAPQHLQGHFKHAFVAGISRLGMSSLSYELTLDETDKPAVDNGRVLLYYVQASVNKTPETMPHWFYWCLEQCRLSLTKQALHWQQQEMLVATNTDAVYLKAESEVSYPGREEKRSLPSGSWTKRTLHEVNIPVKRHLYSREKTTTPGMSRQKNRSP